MAFRGLSSVEAQLLSQDGLEILNGLGKLGKDDLKARLDEMHSSEWQDIHLLKLESAWLVERPKAELAIIGIHREYRKAVRKLIEIQVVVQSDDQAGNAARGAIFDRLKTSGPGGDSVKDTIENAAVILTDDPEWKEQVRYDEFRRKMMIKGEPVEDVSVVDIVRWMYREYGAEWSKDKIRDALLSVSRTNRFNPVHDYLTGLPVWDGVERTKRLLFDYFPCLVEEGTQELLEAYGRCWMISLVARAIRPGCQVDSVLTLQGDEGIRKSTGLRALMKDPDWFSDDELNFADDVRLQMQIRCKWLIEIGDFSSVKKSDVDSVKRTITQKESEFVPKYGHETVQEKRTCVFAATANGEQFLTQDGRRWWAARVNGPVAIDKIIEDRDQLFAESMHRYNTNEQWHLSDTLFKAQRENVKQYAITTPMADRIREWTGTLTAELSGAYEFEYLFERVSTFDPVKCDYTLSVDPHAKRSFGADLRSAGWSRKMVGPEQRRVARWFPPKR